MYYRINWLRKFWADVILLMMSVSPVFGFADIAVYSVLSYKEIDSGYLAATSRTGPRLPFGSFPGMLVQANDSFGCGPVHGPPVTFPNPLEHWILVVNRGICSFEDKVRNAQRANYSMVIITNNDSNVEPIYIPNPAGIFVPSLLVSKQTGMKFTHDYQYFNNVYISVSDNPDFPDLNEDLLIPFAVVVSVCTITMITLMICKCIRDRRRARRYRLPASSLRQIPVEKFTKGSRFETCAICLDDYIDGEKLRVLPCSHAYHSKCIDPWLTKRRRVCPICKRKVFAADETPTNDTESESDSDNDERTPLVRPEPVSQQHLSPTMLVRERLLAHLRIASRIRRSPSGSSTNSDSSSDSVNSDSVNADRNTQPAQVIHSINSGEHNPVLDISPSSSSGYNYHGSALRTQRSTTSSQYSNEGADVESQNGTCFTV